MTTKSIEPKERHWEGRETRWEVYFPKTASAPARRRFFTTKDEALEAIKGYTSGREPSAAVGKRKLDMLAQAEALLPPGVSLLDAVRGYLAAGNSPTTLSTLVEWYKGDSLKTASAKYREVQEAEIDALLRRFDGSTKFASITKAQWVAYIESDASYWNRYARRRLASVLIKRALFLDVLFKNPIDGYELNDTQRQRKEDSVFTMSNDDVRVFINHVAETREDLLPAFVLKLWAGIRTAELCRKDEGDRRALRWEDINWGESIVVPETVAKLSAGKVSFWSPALDAWLSQFRKLKGRICPIENLHDVTRKIVKKINADRKERGLNPLRFEQNAFRHTFGTACYIYHDSAEKAAENLRQIDLKVFHAHYKNVRMSKADAKAYFEDILPPPTASNVIQLSA